MSLVNTLLDELSIFFSNKNMKIHKDIQKNILFEQEMDY